MSLKSCARRRPRTFARIMPNPPSNAATPRAAVELLARLTTLSQELAGAFRPATVVELVARTLGEILQPDRLSVILLDAETNRLAVTHDTNPVPARTDDPLLQLALRRGPLAFPRNVQEEARRRGATLTDPPPGSWIGAPLVAAGRAVGAVSLASDRQGVLGEAELTLVTAVLAQAAIALENARLVELRSEEHTSELQSLAYLVCRLLLEKKKTTTTTHPLGRAICGAALESTKKNQASRSRHIDRTPGRLRTTLRAIIRSRNPVYDAALTL